MVPIGPAIRRPCRWCGRLCWVVGMIRTETIAGGRAGLVQSGLAGAAGRFGLVHAGLAGRGWQGGAGPLGAREGQPYLPSAGEATRAVPVPSARTTGLTLLDQLAYRRCRLFPAALGCRSRQVAARSARCVGGSPGDAGRCLPTAVARMVRARRVTERPTSPESSARRADHRSRAHLARVRRPS